MTEVPDADHTFSSAEWRSGVERLTVGWMRKPAGADGGQDHAQGGNMIKGWIFLMDSK